MIKHTFVTFDDNQLAAQLFGERDKFLQLYEEKLGVTLALKGNQLAISGSSKKIEQAKSFFFILYQKLKSGNTIDLSLVDTIFVALAHPQTSPSIEEFTIFTKRKIIQPRSHGQTEYIQSLKKQSLVFGVGPAGTGKTYLAVAMGVQKLIRGEVERIVLTRPAVEAGEKLGFLPGDMKEKVDPYLRPLYDALHDMLPIAEVNKLILEGQIEVAPIAFMRGRTLHHSYIILDEAQNTTPVQMKMILTRLGEGSFMVITGDLTQVDLPLAQKSGLDEALVILKDIPDIAQHILTEEDVVRHPLVSRIVKAYARFTSQ